jgi:hypothetical protein
MTETEEIQRVVSEFLVYMDYLNQLLLQLNFNDEKSVFSYKLLNFVKEVQKLNKNFFKENLLKISIGFLEILKLKYQKKRLRHNKFWIIEGKDFSSFERIQNRIRFCRYSEQITTQFYIFFVPIDLELEKLFSRPASKTQNLIQEFIGDEEQTHEITAIDNNIRVSIGLELKYMEFSRRTMFPKQQTSSVFRGSFRDTKGIAVIEKSLDFKFWSLPFKQKMVLLARKIYQFGSKWLRTPFDLKLKSWELYCCYFLLFNFFFMDWVTHFFNLLDFELFHVFFEHQS